jgi:hypothetical protein
VAYELIGSPGVSTDDLIRMAEAIP